MKNSPTTNKTITWSIAIGFALLFLIATPQTASAQWTTAQNGSDVYKTNNSGNVGIGTATPDANAKAHVYNAPSVGMDIQSADTGG